MNERLPLKIPSGRVHVYFVGKNLGSDGQGGKVERTTVYYSQGGNRYKWMARSETNQRDFTQLGTMDLKGHDEVISWSPNGEADIAMIALPKAE